MQKNCSFVFSCLPAFLIKLQKHDKLAHEVSWKDKNPATDEQGKQEGRNGLMQKNCSFVFSCLPAFLIKLQKHDKLAHEVSWKDKNPAADEQGKQEAGKNG